MNREEFEARYRAFRCLRSTCETFTRTGQGSVLNSLPQEIAGDEVYKMWMASLADETVGYYWAVSLYEGCTMTHCMLTYRDLREVMKEEDLYIIGYKEKIIELKPLPEL